jgi:SWI/SNF-related matrix-associated actin-dependent regulator of chromatin subfamily A member 5
MVVQQGRLKEMDKLSKEDVMAAVRFGADAVFRSEESTITDMDIDTILEQGKAKTEELAKKIQKAEKGDLLNFCLDGGVSAQTFEGTDYSDAQLQNQLQLLATNSMGKQDRRPPPTTYNAIVQPTKSTVIKNRKIKLPKVLRLPRMEDHQFYDREQLMELDRCEFETYALLKEIGKLPPMEVLAEKRTGGRVCVCVF